MQTIEWRRERRRILLPVHILRPVPATDLRGIEATALLDTGSSVSGVAAALAEKLRLKTLGKRPLASAQGYGQAERYSFRIGLSPVSTSEVSPSFPFVFDEVIGIELSDELEFNALVGMDVLAQCDFAMERTGRCSLCFG
jgi:hypothetical protein